MLKRALIVQLIIAAIVFIPNWIGDLNPMCKVVKLMGRDTSCGWVYAPRWFEGMAAIVVFGGTLTIAYVIISTLIEYIIRGEVHGKVKRHK